MNFEKMPKKENIIPQKEKESSGEYNPNTHLMDSALKVLKNGSDVYNALKNQGDEDEIKRRIEEYSNYNMDSTALAFNGFERYDYLLTSSPAEIKDIYLKDFEPHDSRYYLGSVLTGISRQCEINGFFQAMNSKENILSEDLLKKIEIVTKIVEAKQEIIKEAEKNNSTKEDLQ
jgi:hypothetical protein